MDLHSAGHRRGVVAAPHAAAVDAGRAILAEGGNAIEAMVAMAAVIAVVYPHMNQLGGDGFWLVREPSGRVRALMAAGVAGGRARPELYGEAGLDTIPARGPLAALTVPGAVAGWILALEAAHAFGGKLPLAEMLAPAIRHAREGFAISRSQAACAASSGLQRAPGFAETFLVDGKPPAPGSRLQQPALAATIEQLAHTGLDDFYRGDVGREIADDLDRIGSPVTRPDLAGCCATVAEPLSVELHAGTVFNTPPPTQGLASLMILGLFDRLGVRQAEGFDHIHGLVEAAKRALRLRDRYLTDPQRLPHPPGRYLEPAFLDAQAREIDRQRASRWVPAGGGDTVWLGAADASGLLVSYIQSLYWEFGSGCVLRKTGVLMQNRGVSFSLKRGALNRLEPGRLPVHTLNPALAVLRDGRIMAYGTMGGDAQPQIQAALFTRHIGFRVPLTETLDRPRCVLGQTWGSPHASLLVESRFDEGVVAALRTAGHDVEMLGEPYADSMGHAGAVLLHQNGTLEGAHDPRADGGAAGT
ncbi:MAG TPA: gamma-glutamyltransferase [Xanthobacteraceae bacterium]|jgi:gamma-glutamyltranspeptidase/glutathione hydrolase